MDQIVDVATAIVVVAGIYVLASGNNKGPALVGSIGNAFVGALGVATGQGIKTQ